MKKIERRLLIYVPDRGGPHPVLCFLHGVGEAALGKEGQPQPLAKLSDNGSPASQAEDGAPSISRFLVICPQLEKRRRWEPTDAPWVDEVVQAAIAAHNGDAKRMTLTGFSYGGEGVFQILSESRLAWPTLWAVDPALQRVPPLPPANARVWVHHGNEQPGAENMAKWKTALGLEPSTGAAQARRLLTDVKKDHPNTCTAAYADPAVYEWLLR